MKKLSTKFVRTWREKQGKGEKCWLRRSRYVAREFAACGWPTGWEITLSLSCSCCQCWRRSTRFQQSWWRGLVMRYVSQEEPCLAFEDWDGDLHAREAFPQVVWPPGHQEVMEAQECADPHHDQWAGHHGWGWFRSAVGVLLHVFRLGGVSVYQRVFPRYISLFVLVILARLHLSAPPRNPLRTTCPLAKFEKVFAKLNPQRCWKLVL